MSAVATMHPQPQPMDAETKSRLNSVPAWGSYLYQNFLLPAFSPTASMSEWLNVNTPFAALTPRASAGAQPRQQQQPQGPTDYFGASWGKMDEGITTGGGGGSVNAMPMYNGNQGAAQPPPNFSTFTFSGQPQPHTAPMQQSNSHPSFARNSDVGSSSYYTPQYFPHPNSSSISTSLLLGQHPGLPSSAPGSSRSVAQHPYPAQVDRQNLPSSRNSLNIVDGQLTHSPSPMTSRAHTPQPSPKRAGKRRFDSLDSEEHDHDHDSEHEPDVPEGVERDGMIWGLKVEVYRALSARERKRVRNRISARTFRAKRKEHLILLEESTTAKDLKIRLATEENYRLQQEVAELRRRLAKYEP